MVAKWKARETVGDRPAGPREALSTSLTVEDEAVVVAFRRHTLLPLDDCLYALQATIPHLTRSSLHRCLLHHGISRLPEIDGDKPGKRKFKTYALGFFHGRHGAIYLPRAGAGVLDRSQGLHSIGLLLACISAKEERPRSAGRHHDDTLLRGAMARSLGADHAVGSLGVRARSPHAMHTLPRRSPPDRISLRPAGSI